MTPSVRLRRAVKRALVQSRLPASGLLEGINQLLKLGAWIRQHPVPCHFDERTDLYRRLYDTHLSQTPIAYLEFGVYRGESFRAWLSLDRHPESRFVGFDTFTGLPEDWQLIGSQLGKSHFDAGGEPPPVGDPRGRMVKGIFQATLPSFIRDELPALTANRLVIHLDADLYSSTLYVLTSLNAFLTPGTVVIFDEFSSGCHEFRALGDYLSAYRRQIRPLGAAGANYDQLAVEIVDSPA